jgi:hypothetical protein
MVTMWHVEMIYGDCPFRPVKVVLKEHRLLWQLCAQPLPAVMSTIEAPRFGSPFWSRCGAPRLVSVVSVL